MPKCEERLAEGHLCERLEGSKSPNESFDINTRAVLAFRGIGCGYCAIKKWRGVLNMPYSMSQNGYTKCQEKIEEGSIKTFLSIVTISREKITAAYEEIGVHPDEQGICDIAVPYDGSWQKRGYSSHNGMASVVDLLTGVPIYFEVLSNFCFKCNIAEDHPENEEWKIKHAQNCTKNFDGTAGAMEVECAKRL